MPSPGIVRVPEALAIQTTWMKTTLSLEWRVDFVRGKSSLSRNLSRNYLSPRRSVVTRLVVLLSSDSPDSSALHPGLFSRNGPGA